MKKILFVLFVLSFTITVSAKVESTIQQAFSKYERSSSTSRSNADFLRKFVGDTIMFTFQDTYLNNFTVEVPDTVWIKKRPKKNPILGKHYTLINAYKGIALNQTFVTPSRVINDKPFIVYAVKSYGLDGGCKISLLDPESLDIITADFSTKFPHDGSFRTVKTERMINSLKEKTVYYSPHVDSYSKPIFSKCKVLGGDFIVEINKSTGMYGDYTLNINNILRLQDEKGNVIPFSLVRESSGYGYKTPVVLTEKEYEKQFKCYEVYSHLDLSLLNETLDFPFSFSFITGLTSGLRNPIYQTVDPSTTYNSSASYLDNKELIFVGDKLSIGNKEYYKACLNGKAFLIKTEDVTLNEEEKMYLDTLLQSSPKIREDFFKREQALSYAIYGKRLEELVNTIVSYSKYGLAIPTWKVYDVSEYTDGTGIEFTFYNPTKQTIKYITITFQGYNAVDDPVGRAITRKCIGPIEPDESASYDFEYAWFTDIVEYAKIRSIVVQYKNGTTKTISNPSLIMFSDELNDRIYEKNPVENLR